MSKLILRVILWIILIILFSVLIPALFTNQLPAFLKALSIYSSSLFEGLFELLRASPLVSLIMLLNASLSSIGLFMAVLNNFGARRASFPRGDKSFSNPRSANESSHQFPAYLQYNLDSYNQSIKSIFEAQPNHVVDLIGFSALIGFIISGVPIINSFIDAAVHSLKFSWIIGTPHLILQNVGFLSFKESDFTPDKEDNMAKVHQLGGKRIIFILPTKGGNFNTIRTSAESVIFWKEVFEMRRGKIIEISHWIVCEQDDYENNHGEYEKLSSNGSRIIVVPRNFSTANGTRFKARALTYALKVMDDEGLISKDVWIYHQDDETKIGEDTLIGILNYIANAGPDDVYAAGIIIYSDGLTYAPSRAQEPARSYDDFRILFTTRTNGLLSFGHHGSHLLVRADIEKDIGWDFGDVRTEDWMFGLMLWQRHKPGKTILKGFAYEKPPLLINDLLKQRRRWAHGALQIVRNKSIRLRYRLAALYGMISWFSAFPSLIAFILTIIHPTGGLFPGSGFIAGFTWYSLYRYYSFGYTINNVYIRDEKGGWFGGRVRKILAIISGMILESLAPWYALFKPPKGFEVINKDEGSRRKVANFN